MLSIVVMICIVSFVLLTLLSMSVNEILVLTGMREDSVGFISNVQSQGYLGMLLPMTVCFIMSLILVIVLTKYVLSPLRPNKS